MLTSILFDATTHKTASPRFGAAGKGSPGDSRGARPMSDEPEMMTCESCEEEFPADPDTVALLAAEDWRADYCPECRALHFVCADCGEITHTDDRHPAH